MRMPELNTRKGKKTKTNEIASASDDKQASEDPVSQVSVQGANVL